MSKWIKLHDATNPSKTLHVQASSINYLVSNVKGGNLCDVHLSTEVLSVHQSVEAILEAVSGESIAEDV